MPMQIHLDDPETGKEYHFSPARDIAYFWPQLVELAYEGLQEKRWEPWYAQYLQCTNTTEKDLMDALVAYSKFCMLAVVTEIKTPYDALEQAGWFKCKLPAQLVVCTKFGQICTGAFWAGIRSATPQGTIPADIETLNIYAQQAELELSTKATEDTMAASGTFGSLVVAARKVWRWLQRKAGYYTLPVRPRSQPPVRIEGSPGSE